MRTNTDICKKGCSNKLVIGIIMIIKIMTDKLSNKNDKDNNNDDTNSNKNTNNNVNYNENKIKNIFFSRTNEDH